MSFSKPKNENGGYAVHPDRLPVVGGSGGEQAFADAADAAEIERLRSYRAAAHFQATGEVPADYEPDFSASSSPFHTADEWLAMKIAKASEDAS